MPWGLWSTPPSPPAPGGSGNSPNNNNSSSLPSHAPPLSPPPPSLSATPSPPPPPPAPKSSSLSSGTLPLLLLLTPSKEREKEKPPVSWNDSLNATDWAHYREPRTWIPPLLVGLVALGASQFYRSYLRRIPGTGHIAPGFFRRRSLLGRVTSVGDGDNFHLFHTPGGRLAGWGWLRRVPRNKKDVRGRTIPIRIAGIDAPERTHFGKPAQPFSEEALAFLREYIQGRRVRAYLYKRDQYERVVATVFVRRPPFFVPRRDVGLEMLRQGLATTYEAKSGAEFGGPVVESRYKAAEEEARRRGRGMWAMEKPLQGWFGFGGRKGKTLESPRQFKERMRAAEKGAGEKKE